MLAKQSSNSSFTALSSVDTTIVIHSVQNAAACLVLGLPPRDHVTPGLKKLHWLPIQQRIWFKICVMKLMMHSESGNQCPSYTSQLVQPVNSSSQRQGLRSSSSAKYVVHSTRTAERARLLCRWSICVELSTCRAHTRV